MAIIPRTYYYVYLDKGTLLTKNKATEKPQNSKNKNQSNKPPHLIVSISNFITYTQILLLMPIFKGIPSFNNSLVQPVLTWCVNALFLFSTCIILHPFQLHTIHVVASQSVEKALLFAINSRGFHLLSTHMVDI